MLEDPATGQLFAAAPYTDAAAVEPVLDSSRFFAVRVVGDGGRRAVLGIGFEERGEAFDFGISLQEVRKVNGIEKEGSGGGRKASGKAAVVQEVPEKKDFSLKEGQTIHVDIGQKGRRQKGPSSEDEGAGKALFSIAPPPNVQKGGGGMPLLRPPPSAQDIKAERRKSRQDITPEPGSAADLGFDDGEFGEFQ